MSGVANLEFDIFSDVLKQVSQKERIFAARLDNIHNWASILCTA
jgi:hypothetical protein